MNRILLVEDDSDTRKMLRTALSRDGFTVVEAGDGTEALDIVESAAPDVVVTDLMMPRTDGVQLVRSLRAIQEHAHVPILVLTAAHHQHPGVIELQQVRGVVVKMKPIRPREVCRLVRELAEAG